MAELEIFISENGDITTEIQGIKGSGCEGIAKKLEDIIGKAAKAEKTSDYYKSNNNSITTLT
jgi:hypothetical protein